MHQVGYERPDNDSDMYNGVPNEPAKSHICGRRDRGGSLKSNTECRRYYTDIVTGSMAPKVSSNKLSFQELQRLSAKKTEVYGFATWLASALFFSTC